MSEPSIAEIVQKVRRIQIVARAAVNDLFAGEYHSVFRGRGMEFDEVREYTPGDDIRSIDWNVTARTGTPFIKRFREERELTVIFLVDVSASGVFGSGRRSKLDLVIEIAALLMFSALKNNDKVGLSLFCDDVLRYLPPRKGKANVLRFLRELVAARPVRRETRIDRVLEFLNRVQKRRAVVFLVSDFFGSGFERQLSIAANRHDLVAIRVTDPREQTVPDVGFVVLEDAETGERVELDTHHPRVRALFAERAATRDRQLSEGFAKVGVDELSIVTGIVPGSGATSATEPHIRELMSFFRKREKRR